jgi:hypothetical protein
MELNADIKSYYINSIILKKVDWGGDGKGN